ncbi:alpha-1-antitrypsin homolog [Sinocyclocheilus anshuiensis]|uniref:Alpha-1-antitrypsin homolog n=1 Tax=Sinocyclocheilus anshuiensis TaxID=1608454 RepID=A0A671MN18_9TELE|nr:PREDICTED: alpha-1-antitrypsin homolog [Sinocyclocheilus anshuiensis]
MWGKIYYSVIAALLVATAWAAPHEGHDHGSHTAEHHHHLHHGKDEPHPSHDGEDACHLLAPHNADFAFSLYKKLAFHPDAEGKNVFFSPVGISMALSMLGVGAKGSTLSQIYSSLGYSGLQASQVNEGYEHLIHMLGHSQEAMQLEAGAGVAIREGFKVVDQFLKDVQHYYNSEAFSVDFSKPEIAAEEINKFIAKKTHDKITNMVKDLDSDMVMMLINYMYFRGKWDKPFDAKLTHKADFKVDKNTTVQVDMMKRTGRYDIYQDPVNQTTVMMVPYKGNTSMMIVLPDEGKMKEVEESICRHHLKSWHDKLFRSSVDLFLPKFSITATSKLNDILQDLGMTDAFSDTADFSGMTEEVKVKVSRVVHQAVLSVDEKGTEAAAATTIEIMPMSLPDNVMLNRPFLVLIVEDTTESILFMGKITNPTE